MKVQDEIWKQIITDLFEDFILFFHKELYDDIDFTKKIVFLDKELQQLHRAYGKKNKFVDKLVRVILKNGKQEIILIHIEIQGYKEKDFAKRMFTYGYRIFDKYGMHPIGIVIFTDTDPSYNPNKYFFKRYNIKWEYSYLTHKLITYSDESLKKDKNPFALAIRAYKAAQKTKNKNKERRYFKLNLLTFMLKNNYDEKKIYGIFRFIDGMLQLASEYEESLVYKEIEKIEGVHNMTYVTSLERIATKKGIIQSKRDDVSKLYQYKYGDISEISEYLFNITSPENLQKLFDIVLYSKNKSEVIEYLQQNK